MSIEVTDYIDVEKRCSDLGIKKPDPFSILPRGFTHAKAVSDLCHESSALDVKALLRQTGVPISVYKPDGIEIPYIQENDNTWLAPVIFLGAATLSENAHVLSVALSVIANYVTDLFKSVFVN